MLSYSWDISKKMVVDKAEGDVIRKYHFESDKKPQEFINVVFDKTLAEALIKKGFTDLSKMSVRVDEWKNGYKIVFEEKP